MFTKLFLSTVAIVCTFMAVESSMLSERPQDDLTQRPLFGDLDGPVYYGHSADPLSSFKGTPFQQTPDAFVAKPKRSKEKRSKPKAVDGQDSTKRS